MRRAVWILAMLMLSLILLLSSGGCGRSNVMLPSSPKPAITNSPVLPHQPSLEDLAAALTVKYAGSTPRQWGERTSGVVYRLETKEKAVALTFDACGGAGGSGYDAKLIDFLVAKKIPATLFLNKRWIEANPDIFNLLAGNPLFEIANHGSQHRPLSITGKSAYHIKGTANVREVVEEVEGNAREIEKHTGKKPGYFRSGTAYYDEWAVRVVRDLGYEAVNFDILGDAGATYSAQKVNQALLSAKPGSIIILHMNHPESGTATGVIGGVEALLTKGFQFVRLNQYPLIRYK